jgi:hypothetical protein
VSVAQCQVVSVRERVCVCVFVCTSDCDLIDAVRLLALLTFPIPLVPRLADYNDHIEHLQQYGQAFLDQEDALVVLMVYLQQPLSISSRYVCTSIACTLILSAPSCLLSSCTF